MAARLEKQYKNNVGEIMKIFAKLTVSICFFAFTLSAGAQEEAPVLPVEMFACNFAGTSDMGDLDRSFAEFNAWADDNGIDDLTMFRLTPVFFSDEFEFDVLGLNIWPDGAAFARGNSAIAGDADALTAFEGVVDCAAHSLYALVGVKPPESDVQDGGLFEFSNCSMKGNRSNDEGIAAVAAVSQLFGRWNINDAHAALFNLAGLPSDASYQFKWVTYYPSYESWGALFDGIIGDGAVPEIGALIDPVMQCDSSRIYSASVMRMAVGE